MNRKLVLWLAQGLGLGRIPTAPGTFGSLLGIVWFAGLLGIGCGWGLIAASLIAALISVWLCGVAERILGEKDPASVVLDELVAMPVCFWFWTAIFYHRHDSFPTARDFMAWDNWRLILGVFVAFRLFDVWKPWPLRQSQNLPGGWGIVVDDLLAAMYVNLIGLAASAARWI